MTKKELLSLVENEMEKRDLKSIVSEEEYEKLKVVDISKPYPNEHAARIRNPGDFQPGSFRSKPIRTGIRIIIGRLKGKRTTTIQSYRFHIKHFTAAQAKKWLRDHNINYISFEAASGKKKSTEKGWVEKISLVDRGDKSIEEGFLPRRLSIIDKFLKEKPHKQRSLSKGFPGFKAALFFKAVSEIVKESYKTHSIFNLCMGELCSPTYSYLEVGRDNREELLIAGYRLVESKDNRKLAVFVEPGRVNMFLNLIYSEKDSDLAIEFLKSVEKYMEEHNFYKGEKITAAGTFLPIPNLDFDDVKLTEDMKQAIKVGALEFFKKREVYNKNNIPYKRGLIFTGQPGTGKTLTGKILMAQSKCTFIWVTSDMVRWPEDVKYIYSMAKELAPCILFMEDLDRYLERSGAVDVIKTQMDGLESVDGICSILCTNYPDKLPKALLDRPSRFDEVIIFELPDKQLRYDILSKIAEPMSIIDKEKSLLKIAEKSEGLTGAHLKEVLIFALLLAADSDRETIEYNDLERSLNKVLRTREIINDKINTLDVKNLIEQLKEKGEVANE
jgi:hypothetical protein